MPPLKAPSRETASGHSALGNVLLRDRHLRLLRRTIRQQETAQAELMPGLKALKRLVDRAGPFQCVEQLCEISFFDHK